MPMMWPMMGGGGDVSGSSPPRSESEEDDSPQPYYPSSTSDSDVGQELPRSPTADQHWYPMSEMLPQDDEFDDPWQGQTQNQDQADTWHVDSWDNGGDGGGGGNDGW